MVLMSISMLRAQFSTSPISCFQNKSVNFLQLWLQFTMKGFHFYWGNLFRRRRFVLAEEDATGLAQFHIKTMTPLNNFECCINLPCMFLNVTYLNSTQLVRVTSVWTGYLQGLIEAFHHADPLCSLFGKLTGLHLEGFHLMVELALVDIRLSHAEKREAPSLKKRAQKPLPNCQRDPCYARQQHMISLQNQKWNILQKVALDQS